MNPLLKNTLAVIGALIIGSMANMALIMVSGSIIPPPEGGDITSMEGLAATIHLFQPKHFIFPFLAHAVGTLVGAFVVVKFAASQHKNLALLIGALFFIGGAINVYVLPAPTWFNVLDLVVAYFPMAIIGHKLASQK